MQHILSLIEDDPGRKRRSAELARAVNLSRAQVYLLFKEDQVGEPPMRHRKHWKMEYAANMLASEFLNVQQVRIRAGFNDDSHFNRDFKRIFGVTPKQYQRLHFKNGNGNGDVSVPPAVATGPHVSVPRAIATGPTKSQQPRVKGEERRVSTASGSDRVDQEQKPKHKDQRSKTNAQNVNKKIRQ